MENLKVTRLSCFVLASEPCSKCLVSWHQIRKCLRGCLRFAYAHRGLAYGDTCLTLNLRWLTLTRVLLTPQPYKGPLPKHERKGLERGSTAFKCTHVGDCDVDRDCINKITCLNDSQVEISWGRLESCVEPTLKLRQIVNFVSINRYVSYHFYHFLSHFAIAFPSSPSNHGSCFSTSHAATLEVDWKVSEAGCMASCMASTSWRAAWYGYREVGKQVIFDVFKLQQSLLCNIIIHLLYKCIIIYIYIIYLWNTHMCCLKLGDFLNILKLQWTHHREISILRLQSNSWVLLDLHLRVHELEQQLQVFVVKDHRLRKTILPKGSWWCWCWFTPTKSATATDDIIRIAQTHAELASSHCFSCLDSHRTCTYKHHIAHRHVMEIGRTFNPISLTMLKHHRS